MHSNNLLWMDFHFPAYFISGWWVPTRPFINLLRACCTLLYRLYCSCTARRCISLFSSCVIASMEWWLSAASHKQDPWFWAAHPETWHLPLTIEIPETFSAINSPHQMFAATLLSSGQNSRRRKAKQVTLTDLLKWIKHRVLERSRALLCVVVCV